MNTTILRQLSLAAALLGPLAFAAGCTESGRYADSHESNTSRQTAYSESDSKGWFGGTTHKTDTAYSNSDGSSSIETETTTTKGNTTTITRERKTTKVDGKVNTDRETRTLVKGTDSVVRETNVAN